MAVVGADADSAAVMRQGARSNRCLKQQMQIDQEPGGIDEDYWCAMLHDRAHVCSIVPYMQPACIILGMQPWPAASGWLLHARREFLKEVSDPNSPGAKTKHDSDRTVPTLKTLRPLLKAARRLLDEVSALSPALQPFFSPAQNTVVRAGGFVAAQARLDFGVLLTQHAQSCWHILLQTWPDERPLCAGQGGAALARGLPKGS